MKRKGILMAGGKGSRMFPVTKYINKHLLPVYDKPMIFYSLSLLLMAGIRDIAIICNPGDIKNYKKLFNKKKSFSIKYIEQHKPNGIGECMELAKDFIGKDNFALVLGDNFLFGNELQSILLKAAKSKKNTLFTKEVSNPKSFGVLYQKGVIKKIVEKPKNNLSNNAVIGVYFYENKILKKIKLKKSSRKEYEITDINNIVLKNKNTKIVKLGRGIVWQDLGSYNNLMNISSFIFSNKNQNLKDFYNPFLIK
jgi:glucose-1-phosphate thymidylyltransferase